MFFWMGLAQNDMKHCNIKFFSVCLSSSLALLGCLFARSSFPCIARLFPLLSNPLYPLLSRLPCRGMPLVLLYTCLEPSPPYDFLFQYSSMFATGMVDPLHVFYALNYFSHLPSCKPLLHYNLCELPRLIRFEVLMSQGIQEG
jgi:hypothetical protein